jgi:hypothetical protein
MSPIGSDEVLVAYTASSAITASASASTFCFSARSSKTASIRSSQRRKPLIVVVADTRSMRRSSSSADRLPRFLRSSKTWRTEASPRASASPVVSLSRTATPAWSAETVAIPAPIRPAPMTPSLPTSLGRVSDGTPTSFLISCVAKNTETSARDTLVTDSSPKWRASIASPSWSEAALPRSTASIAFSGAG